VKIVERYCEPTSGPWRFLVVGLCERKKTSSSASYETFAGSNVTSTTSA
jgi:hypothetical protein